MALGIAPGEWDWMYGRGPRNNGLGAPIDVGDILFPQGGGLGRGVFGDPQTQSLLTLGLGMLAARDRGAGLGEGLFGAFQNASNTYQGAMQNAFRNTALQRQMEREERAEEREEKKLERAERQNAAVTAGRISQGLGGTKDPMAYWRLVQGMPEVQEALSAYGIDPTSITSPEQLQEIGQRLGAAAQVAGPAAPAVQPTDDMREYALAVQQGYKGAFADYMRDMKRAGATRVNVPVNTERSFYGTLADKTAQQYAELYGAAQVAPEAIARAQRVRELLTAVPYTGTGADYKLAVGKAAKALGFNYAGDDIANTEALATEMARGTLDMIKSSGLAGSQGLTEGERKFLERAVAGQITLDSATIARLADLNERTARLTLNRWNQTVGRLDPEQLRVMGMTSINQPAPAQGSSVRGKLTRRPDGTYVYEP